MSLKKFVPTCAALLIGGVALYLAWNIQTPLLAGPRTFLYRAVPIAAVFFFFLRRSMRGERIFSPGSRMGWVLILLVLAAGLVFYKRLDFLLLRERVLSYPPEKIRRWGEFFMVGYRDREELRDLIRRGAVGGFYVTRRNIRGKTRAQFRREIDSLQSARPSGSPPLLVAADQEGGPVNHLAPLAPARPHLKTLLQDSKNDALLARRVRAYARAQARDLRRLGVNTNLAPVADLSRFASDDSRIARRAISFRPERSGFVLGEYARALEGAGLFAAVKHFPGLGRARRDTHYAARVVISASLAEMEKRDWLPFRAALGGGASLLMLGHAIFPALDEKRPVSYSRSAVAYIRREIDADAVLITDDFGMAPVARGPDGLGEAAVLALQAGVDLILLSYDPELYYRALDAVLQAEDKGRLRARDSAASRTRLRRLRARLLPRSSGRRVGP